MIKHRGETGITTRADASIVVGQRCGQLTVIGVPFMMGRGVKNSEVMAVCQCDCGTVKIVRGHSITHTLYTSCGCINRGGTTHGESKTRLHGIWCNMKSRCRNPTNAAWDYYGGRGIGVCNEWEQSYEAFRDWAINNGYKPTLELDRKDVNGNYEPSNCRWATRVEQMRNTRKRVNAKTSKYRGVSRHSQNGTWIAQICGRPGNRPSYIGSFDTEREAAQAYDREAIATFGDFASLNFPRKECVSR